MASLAYCLSHCLLCMPRRVWVSVTEALGGSESAGVLCTLVVNVADPLVRSLMDEVSRPGVSMDAEKLDVWGMPVTRDEFDDASVELPCGPGLTEELSIGDSVASSSEERVLLMAASVTMDDALVCIEELNDAGGDVMAFIANL